MFCAGCGTQIQSGLNYCSRCGRRVAEESRRAYRDPLSIAGNIAGVGFVSYIFVLLILSKSGVSSNVFVPLTFFYFAALFGLCFMFLRQAGAASRSEAPSRAVDRSDEHNYLPPVTTAQLDEMLEPASVTDHTTRTLDEIPLRKS